jgi:hypothetical protein
MGEGLFTSTGDIEPDALPALPYAGTSGWSGSDTSRERQEAQDGDGTTSARQRRVLTWLAERGPVGATWKDVAGRYDWHHGQASGALSTLHKEGRVARLAEERRTKCAVYVLPEHVGDRPTAAHGRQETDKDREIALLRGLLREVRETATIAPRLDREIAQTLDGE